VLQAVEAVAAATVEERDEEALTSVLNSDSECQGEDATCALNALQVKQQAVAAQAEIAEEGSEQEEKGDGAKQADERFGAESEDQSDEELGISLASSCSQASSTYYLLKCADDTVRMYASQISSNLRRNAISKLDLAWPGTGYNQAAFGGQWQVLVAVEKLGGFRVENIVGASGGASSGFLALVDSSWSGKTMMDTITSSLWTNGGWGVSTSGEYTKYKSLAYAGDFRAVKSHGYATMVCDSKSSVSYVVHDFKDQDQAAKAFAASGDVPNVILGNGYSMGGHLSYCHDGGELMGIGRNPLLYYNTNYGHATECSKSCVASLFKKGVQDTISALVSSNLRVGASGGGSIAIQKPQGGHWTLSQYRNFLTSGGFWQILVGQKTSSQRVFVAGSSLSGGGGDDWWR